MKEKNLFQKIGDAYEEWKEEHPVLDKTLKAGTLFLIGATLYSKGKAAGHEHIVYQDNPNDKEELYARSVKDMICDNHAEIDEDIYASLAYDIETAVFSESLDEQVIEENYSVLFAKNGEPKDGSYEILKHVKVVVSDASCNEEESTNE